MKNLELVSHLKVIIKKTSIFTFFILFLIILFHLVNLIYSAEPLNNLTYPGYTEIFNADDLYHKHFFTHFEVPLGFPTLIFITRFLFNIDSIFIVSALGILFSILTIPILFLVIKDWTKNDIIATLGCILYISLSSVILYSTRANSNTVSSFFIILLLLLYVTHSPKINNLRSILFCSTLLVYFRLENIVYLAIFVLFLLINKKRNLKISDYVISYIFIIPHTVLLSSQYDLSIFKQTTRYINEFGINLNGIFLKLVLFYQGFNEIFSQLFFWLFSIGIFYLIFKKKWVSTLIFFGLFFAYLIFPFHSIIRDRHIFSLFPVMIVFIIMGFYFIYNSSHYTILKILLVSLFCVTIVYGISPHFFTKFDKDTLYVVPSIVAGNLLQDKKVILYGDPIEVKPFRRFYNDYVVVYRGPPVDNDYVVLVYNDPANVKPKNIYSFDYVVHIAEWTSNKTRVEKELGLNLELIYDSDGIVHVYKIIHKLTKTSG